MFLLKTFVDIVISAVRWRLFTKYVWASVCQYAEKTCSQFKTLSRISGRPVSFEFNILYWYSWTCLMWRSDVTFIVMVTVLKDTWWTTWNSHDMITFYSVRFTECFIRTLVIRVCLLNNVPSYKRDFGLAGHFLGLLWFQSDRRSGNIHHTSTATFHKNLLLSISHSDTFLLWGSDRKHRINFNCSIVCRYLHVKC